MWYFLISTRGWLYVGPRIQRETHIDHIARKKKIEIYEIPKFGAYRVYIKRPMLEIGPSKSSTICPAIHISFSKFPILNSSILFNIGRIKLVVASWLCGSCYLSYNTQTRTQPSSVCPDFWEDIFNGNFHRDVMKSNVFCLLLFQRSVDQADADMYRELYQRNQSLQKQLLEAREVS